jgi:23S rRNA (guanosine2251-2'-O)-methyltransferase
MWFVGETRGRRGELIEQAKTLSIPVLRKKKERFAEESIDSNHQGVALLVKPQDYVPLDTLLSADNPLIIAFDQVTDPRNLGASLRSAEALGGTGAVITKNRCARLGPTVCKTSVGASEVLPVAMETNLARAIALAKDAGALVLGTAFDGRPPSEFDLSGPTMIVVGSEGKGLRPSTESACDAIVTIPMMGITAQLFWPIPGSKMLLPLPETEV